MFNSKISNYSTTFNNNLNINKKSLYSEEELILLEKIKAKHKLEAHNLIEYEMKQQILRKDQEEKLLGEKQEEEIRKKDAIRRKKIRDLENRKKDLLEKQALLYKQSNNKEKIDHAIVNDKDEKLEKIKAEESKNIEEENINDQNFFYGLNKEEAFEYIDLLVIQIDEEISRIQQEQLEEVLKKKQFAIREAENKRKLEEFNLNLEKASRKERRDAQERKKILEQKEKERLESIEKKRIKKIKENEKMKKLHQIRFEKTQIKLEEKNQKELENINKKQLMSEEKRNQLEELRSIELKKKVMMHLQKQDEIQKFMEKNKEIEEMKFFEFFKKMDDIEKNKKFVDKQRDEEIKNRILELKMKSVKTLQSRIQLEKQDDKKREIAADRINIYYHKSQKKKEEKEREQMFINEKHTLKRNDWEQKVKRIENIKEVERLIEKEKIGEIYKKLEEFQDMKLSISNKKRILSIETANQRKIALNKFDNFMNKNKEITVINYTKNYLKIYFVFLFFLF